MDAGGLADDEPRPVDFRGAGRRSPQPGRGGLPGRETGAASGVVGAGSRCRIE